MLITPLFLHNYYTNYVKKHLLLS